MVIITVIIIVIIMIHAGQKMTKNLLTLYHSALVRVNEELLERKVAAPV
jgi:hypothetical protein